MNRGPADFDAGPPRLSGPIRRLGRPLGPLALPFAGRRWLPLYSILRHKGRTTGKAYSTPVVGLRTPDGFLIPLPFGDATQWARNLFASGRGQLRHGGLDYEIDEPRVVDRETAGVYVPRVLRFVAGRLGLRQYILVRTMPRQIS